MDNEYFVSINDVSKRLSVPAHTLRYWEKQFGGAIRPVTGAGGRRYYRQETIDRLTVIRDLLYKNGLTIAGVRKLIHDGNLPHVSQNFRPKIGAQPEMALQNTPNATTNIDDSMDVALDLLQSARNILTGQ